MTKFLQICAVLLAFAGFMLAAPVGATSVNAGTPVTLGSISAGTASAWGGNITQVNLTINSSTLHWQGFYGSVTASLRLAAGDEGSISTLKVWDVSTVSGQVYVSQSSSVDFTNLTSNTASLANVDSAFSFLSGAADSAANTGSDSSNPAFSIGTYSASSDSYPLITTWDNESNAAWQEVIMRDSDGTDPSDFVFVGILNDSGVAFNGDSAHFQVIVPEDSEGDSSVTTYYFYGEVQ